MTMYIKLFNSTAMYKFLKTWNPGGIRIFCSVGGRDDHYATPPGQVAHFWILFLRFKLCTIFRQEVGWATFRVIFS
jgi:hypothetical protein